MDGGEDGSRVSPLIPLARMRRVQWVVVVSVLTVLTLWMLRPLPAHLDASVVGPPGDNLFFVWLVDWYRASLGQGVLPLEVPRLNAPQGWHLAFNEMTPTMALTGLPGFLFGGPAMAYNTSFVLSFVLTGVIGCFWAARLTGRLTIGVVAGIALAFAPYRMSHALGHLNLLGTQWLVLYFCCLTTWLHEGGRRWVIGAAVALVAIAGTSQYYLYMSGLLSLVFAWSFLRERPGWYRSPDVLNDVGAATVVALPPIALLVWPYVAFARAGYLPPRTFDQVQMWSASVTDFFLPSPLHWALGDWVVRHFDRSLWVESTISLGLVIPVFAVIGWWHARRAALRPLANALALGAGVSAVLALGMDLRWLGHPVDVPVPGWFAPWVGGVRTTVSLPGAWLFEHLPYYASMRVWMRWGYFVTICLVPLAGLGMAHVWRGRSSRVVAVASSLLAVLVVAEVAQRPFPVTPIAPRPADRWLAAQAGDDLVVQLPATELGEPAQTLNTSFHGKPFAGAFFGAFLTSQYRRYGPRLATFPSPEAMGALRDLHAGWLLVDVSKYADPEGLERATAALGLHPVTRQGTQWIFDLR